jgi:hypothetical protein
LYPREAVQEIGRALSRIEKLIMSNIKNKKANYERLII